MPIEKSLILEEIANSLTHGLGLILSLAGLAALIFLAWTQGTVWHLTGCSIYGVSLVLVYAASTLYHSIQRPRLKEIFRLIDQVAIYIVIAGTYTPFTLVNLRGFWGWLLLTLVWSLSLFGIAFKIVFANRYQAVSILLYVLNGWAAIIAVKPLLASIPTGGLAWILAGGAAYMVGLVFYGWERLPFNHTIWHLFVMAGSICHYLAVMFYVLPVKTQ
ncbi:MAG TPA: hemolysin III family protein [Blastocatellia bacterium]|nr:hemolysin III family protein [Blastocatellia bacterium]